MPPPPATSAFGGMSPSGKGDRPAAAAVGGAPQGARAAGQHPGVVGRVGRRRQRRDRARRSRQGHGAEVRPSADRRDLPRAERETQPDRAAATDHGRGAGSPAITSSPAGRRGPGTRALRRAPRGDHRAEAPGRAAIRREGAHDGRRSCDRDETAMAAGCGGEQPAADERVEVPSPSWPSAATLPPAARRTATPPPRPEPRQRRSRRGPARLRATCGVAHGRHRLSPGARRAGGGMRGSMDAWKPPATAGPAPRAGSVDSFGGQPDGRLRDR